MKSRPSKPGRRIYKLDIGDLKAPQSGQLGTEEKRSRRPGGEIHSLPQLNNFFFRISLERRATAHGHRYFARDIGERACRTLP